MLSFLAGFGITLVVLMTIFGTIIAFATLIAVIRVAINKELGSGSKVVWILLCLIPGFPFLYFAFVDKNLLLKVTGWGCLIMVVLTALTGGTALWGGVEAFKHHPASFSLTCHDNEGDILCKEIDPSYKAPPAPVPTPKPEKPSSGKPDSGISL